TGGFVWQTPWLRLASRDPFRPLLLGVCCALVYWYSAPAAGVLDRLEDVVTRRAGAISAAVAIFVVLVGVKWGTYAASGADAYGYVSQADLWLAGRLHVDQRPLDFGPPFDDWALSPLGYRPGTIPHVLVPLYSPGLPLLIAAMKSIARSNG